MMVTECEGAAMAVLLAARGGAHAAVGRWAGDMIVLIGAAPVVKCGHR